MGGELIQKNSYPQNIRRTDKGARPQPKASWLGSRGYCWRCVLKIALHQVLQSFKRARNAKIKTELGLMLGLPLGRTSPQPRHGALCRREVGVSFVGCDVPRSDCSLLGLQLLPPVQDRGLLQAQARIS